MFAHDPTSDQQQFGFLLLPGFSTLCLANSVEPLRAVNEITGEQRYVHRLLSLDGEPVSSSSGIEVKVDAAVDDAGRMDVFFLIASRGFRDIPRARLMPALRRAAGQATVVGGMDTAPWLLGTAGLLDGCTATVHWQELERFQADFPEVTVSRARYVIDGNRITCGGATTVLDMMLGLLRLQVGEVLALDVMRLFIYDAERPADGEQQTPLHAPFVARAPFVAAAIAEMEQAIEDPLGIADIAVAVGASQRKLERAFERALGVTPQRYYQYLRLATARRMLAEGTRSVTMVAASTGFASATSFARAYRRMFGHAPTASRR
jgi:transcriptional regulator GlxA family with amidase domain